MRIPTSFNMMGAGGAEEVQTPLTFTAQQAGSTVKLEKIGSPYAVDMYTSTDGENWTPYTIGATITLANIGDTVRFWNHNDKLSLEFSDYYFFSMTGAIAASGNVNSMINYGELTSYCYSGMFRECTSLTNAPELPATTMAYRCYDSMFYGCTSMTTAPALPATTLTDSCYTRMFYGCTSLANVEVAFTSFSNCSYWLSDVSPTGTFRCPTALGTNETIQRGYAYCPSRWTVVNTD